MPIRFSSKCRRILPRDATFILAGWQDRRGENLIDGATRWAFAWRANECGVRSISGEMRNVAKAKQRECISSQADRQIIF
jgi:hypothetical protein